MHQADLPRPLLHRHHETDQPRLIGMGRIPADAVHACTDVVALAIEFYIAVASAKALDDMAWHASSLIANE